MATAKRTLRNRQRRELPNPNPLAGGATTASAHCGATFLAPTANLQFSPLDTINVAYRSNLAHPALSCWCGAPGRETQKFRVDHASPFNGSAQVLVNFSSDGPCWFDLTTESGDCHDTSEVFFLSPNQGASPTASTASLAARTAAAVDSQAPSSAGDSFSTGAKAALGIGIALICIAIGAMSAFLYFRRRRREHGMDATGGIIDHDPRLGRRVPERRRKGASSDTSGQSDEPLCPIQPVFDGFPGSTGYDDVRSLHSTIQSHSPTGTQSPTHTTNNPWTYERSIEREELTAARLKSQLHPSTATVVSYGPNPVTPTLTPRVTPRVNVSSVVTPTTPVGTDSIPFVPTLDYSDYTSYSIPPLAPKPDTKPSPPRQPAVPIVVSYGPNKVTPTPVVLSPTVPPDETIVNRRLAEVAAAGPGGAPLERQFSWEADSPLLGASSMGPLPPYASTADFEAMEKGAVRKLAEPQAEAELPPTKDGFYHYTSDVVEYELPGAAPQRAPQLPFRPYKVVNGQAVGGGAGGVGRSGNAGGVGGGPSAGRAHREIDEQKFLLSDEEIARMRVEKAKIRAAAAAKAAAEEEQRQQQQQLEGESYDLGEPMEGRR